MRRRHLYEHGRRRDMRMPRGFRPGLQRNEMHRHQTGPVLRYIFVRSVDSDLNVSPPSPVLLFMNAYRCPTQAVVGHRENKKSPKRNVAVRPAEVGANSVRLVRSPEVVKKKKLRVLNNGVSRLSTCRESIVT